MVGNIRLTTAVKGVSDMKMTKAFIRNIGDDFACGLGRGHKSSVAFSCEEIDELFSDSRLLREYVGSMLELWHAISLDSVNPLYHYPKIRCYEAFLRNSAGGE